MHVIFVSSSDHVGWTFSKPTGPPNPPSGTLNEYNTLLMRNVSRLRLYSMVHLLLVEEVTHIFKDVSGSARGGRAARRREFINFYDTLLDNDDECKSSNVTSSTDDNGNSANNDDTFTTIVEACGEFVDLNNQMMMAVKQSPWWKKYVTTSILVILWVLIWRFTG